MRRLGVLALVAACGPASQPQAPIKATVIEKPTPVLIDSEVDSPYASLVTPVLDEACETALAKAAPAKTSGTSSPKTKIYEFVPFPIAPVRYGPQIRDMPRVHNEPRNPALLSLAKSLRGDVLKGCYRWARWAKHDLAGTMKVAIDLDVLGNIGAITVEDAATWGEMSACVASVMTPLQAHSFVPRPTRIEMSIDFALSGQKPPRARPARPIAVKRPPLPKECGTAQATVDAVTYASPLGKVDDYDEMQARREEAEARCKAAGTKRCRITVVPRVMIGTPAATGDLDKATIRAHIHYNDRAFGTCFADASDRNHGKVPGEVAINFMIAPDGSMPRVEIEKSTTGDAVLDECVRAALAEVRFPPASGGGFVNVHIPFVIAEGEVEIIPAPQARDEVVTIERTAKAALDGGDTESAVRRYAALAKNEPTCARQADLVGALYAAHPWIDDSVMVAAADLVAMKPTGACATAAAQALIPLAIQSHRLGAKTQTAELLEIAVERYRAILTFATEADASTVRPFLVDALYELHRNAEAEAIGVKRESPRPKL